MFKRDSQFLRESSRRSRAAFTLVELLVVIGIIVVLIAILVPVLGKARAAANRTVCLSNIRQLGLGVLMYCNNNKGLFPTCAYWELSPAYTPYPDDWLHWQANRNLMDSAIAKYVARSDPEKFKTLLRCPSDNLEWRKTRTDVAPGQGPYLYSYGMNASLAANVLPRDRARTKITMWRAPSRKIMLTEPWEKFSTMPGWDYASYLTRRHGSGVSRGTVDVPAAGQPMGTNVSAAFLDGHAEPINEDFSHNLFHMRPEAQ